jgi:ATP-dependent Lhr-like helicase
MFQDITVLYYEYAGGKMERETKRKEENKTSVFGQLEPELRKLVGKRFKKPTPIQADVIPLALDRKNLLVISETGSGKTEACMLPVFDLWIKDKPDAISILYITPLKSLNRDLLKRILWWSNGLDFDVSVRHGDTSTYERKMQSENPPDMLISTPETLQAVLTGKIMREHLKNIRYIIIDEVHELVPSKRGLQLTIGLERLKELIKGSGGQDPQIITLSATVGSPENIVDFFSLERRKSEIVNVISTKKTDIRVECPRPDKDDAKHASDIYTSPQIAARLRRIRDLINQKESVLTFTNTREFAEILSSRIRTLDKSLAIETHHSSLSKGIRIQAEKDFRDGKIKTMVCTSSLELGIDIGKIDFVIQYQSPRQVAKFLQRIGRAGHTLSRISDGMIISGDPDDCFESSVIARHALEGKIEPTMLYRGAWDVLAHQIVGLTLEEYNIPMDKVFDIIRKAYPYRNVTKEQFFELCNLVQRLGYIWVGSKFDEGVPLRRRRKAFEYYFGNLSTIPNIKNYQVHDVVSDKPVGTLDAEFIAMHGTPGTAFIVKGQSWKILEARKNKIFVEPMSGIEAAIPAWDGELIPIPYDIAQGVGKLRKEIAEQIGEKGKGEIIGYITKNYPVDRDVAERMYSTVLKQKKWGTVPDDNTVLIEHRTDEDGAWVVIHTCWGSLVNDTIGRVLSSLLINKLGSIGLQSDAYKITIRMQEATDWKEAVDVFMYIKPEEVKPIVMKSLPNSELFTWRFIHVCQRFGIISKDANYGKGYMRKIAEVYANTPPYKEALSEIDQEKLDISKAAEILGDMKSGKIRVEQDHRLSPLSEMALNKRFELIAPERPEKEIFRIFRNRLLETKVGLVCTQCGWASINTVKNLKEHIHCPLCYAAMVSIVPSKYVIRAQELVKKKKTGKPLSDDDKRWDKLMMDNASLVIASGKNAALVLAGRGVGNKTAGRILSKMRKDEDLLREILREERNYARNRRFWKD